MAGVTRVHLLHMHLPRTHSAPERVLGAGVQKTLASSWSLKLIGRRQTKHKKKYIVC